MLPRARILIVDDDPMYRSLLTTHLRRGHLVSVAADGSEAFFKALEHPPDLVVLDLLMPGWDGLKTLQAFRNHPALHHVPIIIVSSDATRESVVAAKQRGATDYVLKDDTNCTDVCQKIMYHVEHRADGRLAPNRMTVPPAIAQPARSPRNIVPTTLPGGIAVSNHNAPAVDLSDLQSTIDGWE